LRVVTLINATKGMNIMTLGCLIGIAALLVSTPAFAGWEYIEWRMSVDEAVAASKGELNLGVVAEHKDRCHRPTQPVAYAKSKKVDGGSMDVTVCADASGRLTQIDLRSDGSGSYGLGRWRKYLTSKYGPPFAEAGLDDIMILTTGWAQWRDPKGGNSIALTRIVISEYVTYSPLSDAPKR
jgi:hypothetical protein